MIKKMYCSITHYNKYLFCFINKHMLLCHNRSWIIPTGDHKKKTSNSLLER